MPGQFRDLGVAALGSQGALIPVREAMAGRADVEWDAVEALLDKDPRGEDFNTGHEACSRHSGKPGVALTIVGEDGVREHWTYAELDRLASKVARVLANAGLKPGDRVAGLLSRQVESWIVAVAVWRSGLVYVPLFGGFAVDAIGLRLHAAEVRAVVADGSYLTTLVSALDRHDLDPYVLVAGRDSHAAGNLPWFWKAVGEADSNGPIVATHLDDTATILFTSGTSGAPKGCTMTHAALVSVVPYVRHVLALGEGSLFATADPGWAFGLYTTGVSVMALGVPRVMYAGASFVPENWHRVVVEEKVTAMATAPAAIRRLSATFGELGVPTTLQTVATAGESLTEAVATEWGATGAPFIRNGYGLSEIGMVLADTIESTSEAAPGSLATVLPGFDVFLSDRDGQPVAPGGDGLIAVRRPRYQMSANYVNAPQQWVDRWRGGSFVTEDRATVDAAGRWRIVGRDDDMMVVSGHNISPVEVENALLSFPGVQEAAAVAHTDSTRGEVVRVVVVAAPGIATDDSLRCKLKEVVAQSVGKYATPRVVDFVDTLPRTEVGKLRRASLRMS